MGLFGRLIAPWREKAASPHEQWFFGLMEGLRSAAGMRVTPATALEIPTVYAAVNDIAQDVAKLPLIVLRVDGDDRARWRDNRLWPILHDAPWEGLTSYRFRLSLQAQVMTRGNAFAEIYRDGRGRVIGLKPFRPGTVTLLRYEADGTLYYEVRDGARAERLSADRVFHLRALTLDGDCGISPVHQMRESFGIALAAQDYAARFFSNDATPRTVFERPGHFQTDEAREKFRDALVSMLTGENRHKPLLMEDGLVAKQLGMNNEDAQLVDTRKLQRSEAAAALRITPHKIGDLERATFSNVEQMSIDYVQDTLMPWARAWESELWLALVPEAERAATEIKLVLDGMLRGDSTARANYYKAALGATGAPAWMTPNEIRKLEDMNPHPDGDYLPVPAKGGAAAPAGEPDAQNAPTDAPADQPRDLRAAGEGRLRLRAVPGARTPGGDD